MLKKFATIQSIRGIKKWPKWILIGLITILMIRNYLLIKYPVVKNGKTSLVGLKNALRTNSSKKLEGTPMHAEFVKNIVSGPQCGSPTACPSGQVAYHLKSGRGVNGKPIMCWNGNYLAVTMKNNVSVGMHLAVVNPTNLKIGIVRTFDLTEDVRDLEQYFSSRIPDKYIVLVVARTTELLGNFSPEVVEWLRYVGSSNISRVSFRDAFVMVGQAATSRNMSTEKRTLRGRKDFADEAEIQGCFSIMVSNASVKMPFHALRVKDQGDPSLKEGQEAANCGVKDVCAADSFAVHLYTGVLPGSGPKLCVGGKYVLQDDKEGSQKAARGVNVVVLDPTSKQISRMAHFDTYDQDSINLEILLETMVEGEMIVVVSHDEASTRMHRLCRKRFEELGSSGIHQLSHRDNWVFIGQKGIQGFSPIEQLVKKKPKREWPERSIELRFCAPTHLQPQQFTSDPDVETRNNQRLQFCEKHPGLYGEFCSERFSSDPLIPALLKDKSLENHEIFDVPILIIAGPDMNVLRMQCEAVLHIPGIRPDRVIIARDKHATEPAELGKLFGYRSHWLPHSKHYSDQVKKALAAIWDIFPTAVYVTVLEEQILVTPDLLAFFAQLLPTVAKDNTLMGISSWNVNGYVGVSGRPEVVYRTEDVPGYGYLLKKSAYTQHVQNNYQNCCKNRAWLQWHFPTSSAGSGLEMLVPDASRSFRRPFEGLSEEADLLTELFNRDRVLNRNFKAKLKETDKLSSDVYDEYIMELLHSSRPLAADNFLPCFSSNGSAVQLTVANIGNMYSIYYEQSSPSDFHILKLLCNCFGLFKDQTHGPRGLHKGLLRFTYKSNLMFLVGSQTMFYSSKPAHHTLIRLKQLKP